MSDTTKRKKHGGRQKGTPNKDRAALAEKLKEMNCDPLMIMAQVAIDAVAEGNRELALQASKELAQYVAPKRKAVEHSGPEGEAIQHNLEVIISGV